MTESLADFNVGDNVSLNPTPCCDMRHLVLLHHLESQVAKMTRTSATWLAGAGAGAETCVEAIFQSAFSSPYLMHELLAFSALHLSTLQSDEVRKSEFLRQSAELQTQGLSLFNAAKPEVRNENCLVLFVFAAILGMHTLFDAVASCKGSVALDKIINYLKVHRGVTAITYQSWHTLRHSEIRYIIDAIEAADSLYRQQLGDTENDCDVLLNLFNESSEKLSPGQYKACLEAIQALHWVFGLRRTVSELHPMQITLAWPARISVEFVESLEQRQPIALVILAYWAVLLHADRDIWVFGNAGRHIIECLSAHLGSYWDEWLDLPRSVLKRNGP